MITKQCKAKRELVVPAKKVYLTVACPAVTAVCFIVGLLGARLFLALLLVASAVKMERAAGRLMRWAPNWRAANSRFFANSAGSNF